MLIGYIRVSKADGSQATDLQRDALEAAGIGEDRFYEDHASGKRDNRPGLDACLKALRESDTLVIWKLDRLGRDLRHLVNTVPRSHEARCWFEGLGRAGGEHRHDDRKRSTRVRDFRRSRGVRA